MAATDREEGGIVMPYPNELPSHWTSSRDIPHGALDPFIYAVPCWDYPTRIIPLSQIALEWQEYKYEQRGDRWATADEMRMIRDDPGAFMDHSCWEEAAAWYFDRYLHRIQSIMLDNRY